MGIIYVYHHDDVDGIVAAGILYNHFNRPDNMEFNIVNYSMELNFDHINFENGDTVYFLDYSFSNKENAERFEKLLERRLEEDDVVYIDHHITSINKYSMYNINGVLTSDLCGAALTYLYLNKLLTKYDDSNLSNQFHEDPNILQFLKYIDDYDCWKKIYTKTNAFHYGFLVKSPEDNIIRYLLSKDATYTDLDVIMEKGEAIINYLEFNDKVYHIDMYGFEFTLSKEHGGIKCFCLNRKGNSLMFGNKINEYDAVIPFYYENGKWKHSIYTNKDYVNCELIAKSYGGGGHKKAAGWVSDRPFFEKVFIIDSVPQPKSLDEYALEPICIKHDRYYCPSCGKLHLPSYDEMKVGSISRCICGQKLDYSNYRPKGYNYD